MNSPVMFHWSERHCPSCGTVIDKAMVPWRRFTKVCDERYALDQDYRLEQIEERSRTSHDQQFAWLQEAWRNLPEQYQFEPWAQSPEHLRKYALIRARFCTTEQFPCATHAEAERWAARLRADDEFCIVTIAGSVVNRFRAESQSYRSMKGKRFQESKIAVMDFVSGLLGVSADELERNAGKAA